MQHKKATITGEELINDFGITFVDGAIYKDDFGNYWECSSTGNFIASDCYELNKAMERIDSIAYPMRENDLIEFIGFAEELQHHEPLVA